MDRVEIHGSLKAAQQGFSGSVGINIVILSDFPGFFGENVVVYLVAEGRDREGFHLSRHRRMGEAGLP